MIFRKLTRPLFRQGKGLHSGREFSLSIEPSEEPLSLEAWGERLFLSELVLEGTGRGSDLIFPSGKRVRTCEHVLSALTGLGVWRAKLIVSGEGDALEMPGLDGCAENVAQEVLEASVEGAGLEPLRLQSPLHVEDLAGGTPRFVTALPSPDFRVTCVIDYDAASIGTEILNFGESSNYLKEIAPARTFAMRADIEALRAAGLALGGSLTNAILVDKAGIETEGGLRFSNEFVRHKTLDLLGDLACLGRPLAAHVVAVRAGHVQHLRLVERLRGLTGPRFGNAR
jgi:UDP-3-O-[3-hydroxymyristoyl] N-acetylglucosamine deacetylase